MAMFKKSSLIWLNAAAFLLAAQILGVAGFGGSLFPSVPGRPTAVLPFQTRRGKCRRHHHHSVLSLRGGDKSGASSPSSLGLVDTAIAAIDAFYKTAPYAAGAITCGAKASAADYVAQKTDKEKNNFQVARNVAFLVYGAIYQGMAQEFIYNHMYPLWFGRGSSPSEVLRKVFFDLVIQTTLVTLPIAYLTKAVIFRHSFIDAMKRYWHDITHNGLLNKYFLLWGPVQCVTFSIVPEHLRISFIAMVSFFWLIVFSTVSSRRVSVQVD